MLTVLRTVVSPYFIGRDFHFPYIVPSGEAQAKLVEATVLSSDAKPTEGILQGSLIIEVDTGKVFLFSGTAWVEQFCLQA